MDAGDKKLFIKNLCDSIRDELISKIPSMPDEWDGIELRQLLAKKFEAECWSTMQPKRLRAFRNEVLTRNL